MWAFAFWSNFKQKSLLPHVKGSLNTCWHLLVEREGEREQNDYQEIHIKKDNILHLILKLLGNLWARNWFGLCNNYDHNVPNVFFPSISSYLQKKINTLITQSTTGKKKGFENFFISLLDNLYFWNFLSTGYFKGQDLHTSIYSCPKEVLLLSFVKIIKGNNF